MFSMAHACLVRHRNVTFWDTWVRAPHNSHFCGVDLVAHPPCATKFQNGVPLMSFFPTSVFTGYLLSYPLDLYVFITSECEGYLLSFKI
jgi:hypothetical protein